MTVEDLKSLIEDLPDNMIVIMPSGEDVFLSVCREKSCVCPVQYPEQPVQQMLVLFPCSCPEDTEMPIDLDTNLN